MFKEMDRLVSDFEGVVLGVTALTPEKKNDKGVFWIDNSKRSIFDQCSGTSVLIRFKGQSDGITCGSLEGGRDFCVDISWIRSSGKIIASTGSYEECDIDAWALI